MDYIYGTLKDMRRNMYEVSITRDYAHKELRILTDAGRICRPLLTVSKQRLLFKREYVELLRDRESTGFGLVER